MVGGALLIGLSLATARALRFDIDFDPWAMTFSAFRLWDQAIRRRPLMSAFRSPEAPPDVRERLVADIIFFASSGNASGLRLQFENFCRRAWRMCSGRRQDVEDYDHNNSSLFEPLNLRDPR